MVLVLISLIFKQIIELLRQRRILLLQLPIFIPNNLLELPRLLLLTHHPLDPRLILRYLFQLPLLLPKHMILVFLLLLHDILLILLKIHHNLLTHDHLPRVDAHRLM